MPRPDCTAYLVFQDGSKIAVHPGNTIGVVRRSSDTLPTIELDKIDFPYASQMHGVFGYNGSWYFENKARNGSVVYGHKTIELRKGDRARLDHGSIIVIAHGEPLEFKSR